MAGKQELIRVQQDGDVNPFTKQPHSGQYKKILEARKKLPVFAQMDEFFKIVSYIILCLEGGIYTAISSDPHFEHKLTDISSSLKTRSL